MLPVAGLIMQGLSLMPKIPAMWESVASLFGKETPKSVKAAGELAGKIMGDMQAGKVSPEIQVQLESRIMEHEETIMRIKAELKKAEMEDLQHQRNTMVALWANEQHSTDVEVQRTRPAILRDMWKTCKLFCFYAPLCMIAGKYAGIDTAMLLGVLKWVGGFLFGTFVTAYTGYTAARSIDKKAPDAKDGTGTMGKAMGMLLKMGGQA